jgi:hypothetical protein
MYRRIDVAMWGDRKFRNLSPPQPCGQFLWIFLLTGKYTINIPGVVIAKPAEIASYLEWPLDAFRDAMSDVIRYGLAMACPEAGLVWLPNGIKHNPPQSLNVIRGWAKTWGMVPECDLKDEILRDLFAYVDGMSDAFRHAMRDAFAMACRPVTEAVTGSGTEKELPGVEPKRIQKRGQPKPVLVESLAAAEFLFRSLTALDPEGPLAKLGPGEQVNRVNTWAADIDQLHRADGQSFERIDRVLGWLEEPGNWWRPKIIDGAKLREKFQQLAAQMKSDRLQKKDPQQDIRYGSHRVDPDQKYGRGKVKL